MIHVIAGAFPFRPALDALSGALSSSGPNLGLPLLHLALLTVGLSRPGASGLTTVRVATGQANSERPNPRAATWRHSVAGPVSCLPATTSPACQPGARPPAGGRIDSTSSPLRAITQAITEFEFHISPVAELIAPPDRESGPVATTSSTRRAQPSSSVSRRGLSTASATSGM